MAAVLAGRRQFGIRAGGPALARQHPGADRRGGKRFERVRLVDEPATDGQRFLLASGLGNVEAGEDIRNLYRADAQRLGLPDYDFWLFDCRLVMKFHFSEEGETLGVELIEEPAEVLRACQVRDLAWHYAVPTKTFQEQVRSLA